ncbi:hypothetical protein LJC09_05195, partial [Desulfovibrio sp. OttesenSCG-928-F20]|nr:hypothetical protein [Desulfovibrio sp. OttesenSCG-928-F20]
MGLTECRPGPDDAALIAAVINKAGNGVISYLLDGLAPGFSGEDLLAATLRDQKLYGPDCTLMLRLEDKLAGLLIAYPAELHVIHPTMQIFVSAAKIKSVRPMLESAVPDSLHINIFWLDEKSDDNNAAHLLLRRAREQAVALNKKKLGVFCRESEHEERQFFEAAGFTPHTVFAPEDFCPNGIPEGGCLL